MLPGMSTPEKRRFTLGIVRPTGLGHECTDIGTYMFNLGMLCCQPAYDIQVTWMSTPRSSRILMNRNGAVLQMLENGCDFILMVDPDMVPDMYFSNEKYPQAQQFFPTAWKFLQENPFGVVGAPAVRDPPSLDVNVFQAGDDGRLVRITKADAAARHADPLFERVDAIGSGLLLIDALIFRRLPQPWFFDLYRNKSFANLSTSQDIYFTQQCTLAGIPVFANWYAWAGHHKDYVYGVPDEEPRQESADEWGLTRAETLPVSEHAEANGDTVPPGGGGHSVPDRAGV